MLGLSFCGKVWNGFGGVVKKEYLCRQKGFFLNEIFVFYVFFAVVRHSLLVLLYNAEDGAFCEDAAAGDCMW